MDVAALKAAAAGSAGDDPWARARRSAASSDQRDLRGGMAPPLTSLRRAKRHGARAVRIQIENGRSRCQDSSEP